MVHGLWFLFPLVFFGKIFWIVILALLIGALIRGRSRFWRYGSFVGSAQTPISSMQQPSALEILRQRYARGEMDGVTYEQMRERLEKTARQS